ncbi:MAG: hypothetical protein Q9208_000802 [Pyrenodesmia sp. 3 TL-2023]
MNYQDSVRIFAMGVEDARREQQTRSHELGPVVDLKLTVDLSKRGLHEVPDDVVELLKVEVERVNEIRIIPEDIQSMRSLRVLSLAKNKILNVPTCVKDLDTLRMLKLAGNPLRLDLASIVEAKDTQLPFDEGATDNEKDTFITSSLKHHLTVEAANESGEGSRLDHCYVKLDTSAHACCSSDGPLETPRPFMRNGSLRFPVRTNGGASEPASEARSPGFIRPPIPAKSHFRVTSGQNHMMQKSGLRRPGLAPLSIGNERNRSNSESVLQATQNNRSKRMGIVPKKKHDLSTVQESKQNRTSWHLRGQSHASALPDWNHEGDVENRGVGNGHSQRRLEDKVHGSGNLGQHLIKARKHRTKRAKTQPVGTVKGVRYSLSTFDQCTDHLIQSLSSQPAKSWSGLKDTQHEASFKLASLHHYVNSLVDGTRSDLRTGCSNKKTASVSVNACNSAIARFTRLAYLLLDQSSPILADGGHEYVRTIILQTLGSSTEVCHAFHGVGRAPKRTTLTPERFTPEKARLQAPPLRSLQDLHDRPFRDQSLTPTRERPVTAKRVKNFDTAQQSSIAANSIKQTTIPHLPMSQPSMPQTAVLPSTVPHSAVPLYINGRSRSNSRADQYNLPSSTDSSFALSPAMTPSSVGAFSVPGTPLNRSRSSSVAAGALNGRMTPATTYFDPDPELPIHFNRIRILLDDLLNTSRRTLPRLKETFIRALGAAQTNLDQPVREEWARRVRTCSLAAELTTILLKRLQAIHQQHPTSTNNTNPSGPLIWNEKSFWELCKKFLAAVSDLLMDVRAGYKTGYIADDIVELMRPVSSLSRAVSHEIHDSPWNTFLAPGGGHSVAASPGSVTGSTSGAYGHSRQRRSSGENSYAAGVPPTPLSAALGPAAQATVPSTPASSGLERSFQGGWMERADWSLQQQQHTMVYRQR